MSVNKRRQAERELELFLQYVAEQERLFIEEYGHEAFLNRLRELIDDDPHGSIRASENPEAVCRGLEQCATVPRHHARD